MKLDFSKIKKDVIYSELVQTLKVKFALCDVVDDIVYPRYKFVVCRDFLLDDFVWSYKEKIDYIYGFSIPSLYEQPKINILVKHTNKFNPEPINQFMKITGKDYTLEEIEHEKDIHVLFQTPFEEWDQGYWDTVRISLLTYVLKQCYNSKVKTLKDCFDVECIEWCEYDAVDVCNKTPIYKAVVKLLKLPNRDFCCDVSKFPSTRTTHDMSGWMSAFISYKQAYSSYGKDVKKIINKLKKEEKLLCAA